MIAYELKYNFVADAMMIDFVSTPRFCCTEIDGFEPCTKIVFETKNDVGIRDYNIITWLTNEKIIVLIFADKI